MQHLIEKCLVVAVLSAGVAVAAAISGCEKVTAEKGPEPAPRCVLETVYDGFSLDVGIVTVDGQAYILARTTEGVAICPKTVPPRDTNEE